MESLPEEVSPLSAPLRAAPPSCLPRPAARLLLELTRRCMPWNDWPEHASAEAEIEVVLEPVVVRERALSVDRGEEKPLLMRERGETELAADWCSGLGEASSAPVKSEDDEPPPPP